MKKKILIIDDDIAICDSLKIALNDRYEVFIASTPSEALNCILNYDIAVTVLDLKLGKYNGMDLYLEIKRIDPKAVVIIITAFGSIRSSIDAIKKGLFHYITKPIDLTELNLFIEKGIIFNDLHKQIKYLSEQIKRQYELNGIIAKSANMQSALNIIEKTKNINSNVLITGESGTGKELIAKAIHYEGSRSNYRFEPINCASIPDNLLESELFGYKAGAFTGAIKDKVGRFELAHKGTLFLDEVGEMNLVLQPKILRAIQDKAITPLGSNKQRQIDVRIVSSTNKNLEEAINNREFRKDLFYRLNVINIHLEPLRKRKEDIPPFISYFIQKYNRILNKNIKSVSVEFFNFLLNYEFYGNVRELENIIERAIALSDSNELTFKDLPKYVTNKQFSKSHDDKLIPIFMGESLKEIEKRVIKITYNSCKNNQKETAKILGITDRTLRNKLKLLNTN